MDSITGLGTKSMIPKLLPALPVLPYASCCLTISHMYTPWMDAHIRVISTLALSKILWPIMLPPLLSISDNEGGYSVIRAYVPAPRRLDR